MPHHHHLHHRHADPVIEFPVEGNAFPSDLFPLPVPTPTEFGLPSLIARADSTSTGSSGEKSTSNLETTVLPVVLGAGVPVLCAIVILIVLHRRHVKKLMREDADDKHRSLDFGLDPVNTTRRKQHPGMPQMVEPTHTKGLSLDVHPYLVPPGLHGSRDSLHSISRSIDDDKYRPATFIPQDNMSIRSYPRTRDDASSVAGSTRFGQSEEPNSGLLRNASRMSRSSPPRHHSPIEAPEPTHHPLAQQETHRDYLGPLPGLPSTSFSEHDEQRHDAAMGVAAHERAASPQEPQHHIEMPEPQFNFSSSPDLHFDSPSHSHSNDAELHDIDHLNFPLPNAVSSHHESEVAQTSTMQLPRISLPASDITSSDYGDDHRKSEFTIPEVNVHNAEEADHHQEKLPELPEEPPALEKPYDSHRDTRRLTLGVRPLPPEDPADNPEQRANRIRSFYKEYFDESKRETTYYEDYGPEFYEGGGGGYAYDPATGEYFDAAPPPMPFAEPMGRRAMTPPPRAPPRFQGAARHMATNSAGFSGYGGPGPRAFSSASNGPRRPMPPPAPLQVLPTPHMLKDDSFLMAAEFAPGKNFRDQQSGRPETPTGGSRPYSPAIRAHTPLMSSFDDLAVIPSAHALRKSGTYTSLDFAPPPRFKNQDSGSDAGSIRSNRTGINNTHMNNIRMGNYRVSRLPGDMVGTKDDMMSSLRPAWDMKR
ncbi:hypothetical protein N7478_006742 [Penicillium angulare]|uniref:uncharacterized protein n=1 Tax=Penicillium angulare TaxID=116970 RepID=UPI0025412BB6|nr:uncharacterized protein N7478_006742 [Penicillium angulare]KAJ5281370.1 hypothetical protein N7478_006742 [Penicillium angulare]